ncbi:NAD(P)H-dependent oxidoreductase [Geomicrobium sp. JCM 19039]|uniref:NAD(P)H-dependent oxidoreductase n=1 Tax=Geomicrobium sp. JCM 19039 TaxID=1460636 RepID=UPI0005A720D4|nr:NAD(P)H-dependent oxidoreductase [Geomicrobium sp. JCM 19039]
MKTLVVAAHPSMEKSTVHKRWLEELRKHPQKYTVHDLYKTYPTEKIDVEKERQLIEAHENLVLQFPIQWFNSPSLLKKWMDEVFDYGWAYGSNGGDKLKDRKVALAVSAGIRVSDYSENGRYGHTLEQILIPFKTTFFYCQADYRSIHAFYGEEKEPGGTEKENLKPMKNELERNTENYLLFLDKLHS